MRGDLLTIYQAQNHKLLRKVRYLEGIVESQAALLQAQHNTEVTQREQIARLNKELDECTRSHYSSVLALYR